jgi:hypothetical protein
MVDPRPQTLVSVRLFRFVKADRGAKALAAAA